MVVDAGELGLVAVGLDGVVRAADDPTAGWEEVGRLDGAPAALEGVGDELLAATHERVLSSRDGGKTRQDLLGAW